MSRDQIDGLQDGFWFVYDWDWNVYPISAYRDEIDALRHVTQSGYGRVVFWPFGVDWDEVDL